MKVKMCALAKGDLGVIGFEMWIFDVSPDEYLERKHYALMEERVKNDGLECLAVFCERERAATQTKELHEFFAW